jgi:hypothetical protein
MTEHDIEKLKLVHPLLAALFVDVASRHSIGVARGAADLTAEKIAKATGHSWLKNPENSLHIPKADGFSHALDFFVRNSDGTAEWDDLSRYEAPARDFKITAAARGLAVILGWDWHAKDAGHVEIHFPPRPPVTA